MGPWGVQLCLRRSDSLLLPLDFKPAWLFPQPQNEFEVFLSICSVLRCLSCLFRGLRPLWSLPACLIVNELCPCSKLFMSSSCALFPSLPLASPSHFCCCLAHESPLLPGVWCYINSTVQGHLNKYHKCTQMHPCLLGKKTVILPVFIYTLLLIIYVLCLRCSRARYVFAGSYFKLYWNCWDFVSFYICIANIYITPRLHHERVKQQLLWL